jgi:uncharacterized membrane protein YidH (DUF202 family)
MISFLLIVIGVATIAYGIWRRIRNVRRGEPVPTARGVSSAPMRRLADILIMIVGGVIVVLGFATLEYTATYAPEREEPPPATTGSLDPAGAGNAELA